MCRGRDELLVQCLACRTMHENRELMRHQHRQPIRNGQEEIAPSPSQRIPGFIVLAQIEPHLFILVRDTQTIAASKILG